MRSCLCRCCFRGGDGALVFRRVLMSTRMSWLSIVMACGESGVCSEAVHVSHIGAAVVNTSWLLFGVVMSIPMRTCCHNSLLVSQQLGLDFHRMLFGPIWFRSKECLMCISVAVLSRFFSLSVNWFHVALVLVVVDFMKFCTTLPPHGLMFLIISTHNKPPW